MKKVLSHVGLRASAVILGGLTAYVLIKWVSPFCFLSEFTKLPCLGCEGTKAFESLMQGRFLESWRSNPLVVLLALLSISYVFEKKNPYHHYLWNSLLVMMSVVVIILLFTRILQIL